MLASRLTIVLPALLAALLAAAPVRAEQPKGEAPLQRAAQGDPLPPGALARLGTLRLRYTERIDKVVFTHDGKRLLGFAREGEGIIWDAATGKQVRRSALLGNSDGLLSCDGRTIAFVERNELVLKDIDSERSTSLSLPGGRRYHRFCVSPDGRTAALLQERGLHCQLLLCDLAAREVRHSSAWTEDGVPHDLAFSLDSKSLLVDGSSGRLHLLDAASGARKRAWRPYPLGATSFALSPDGKALATSGFLEHPAKRFLLRLWDTTTGKLLHEEPRPDQPLYLAFLPDGKTLLSVEQAGIVQLYDGKTGRHLRSLAAGPVADMALAPDGKTLATVKACEQAVDLWDIAGWKPRWRQPGHRCCVQELAFSPDGKLLASSAYSAMGLVPQRERGLLLWDVATGRECGRFGAEWGKVTGLAFSPNGELLAVAADDAAIHLCEPKAHREVRSLGECEWPPYCPRWSVDGRSLLFQAGSSIFVRSAKTGPERRLLRVPLGCRIGALSGDGRLAAWDSEGGEAGAVVQTATGQDVLSYSDGRARAFSADSTLLATLAPEGIVVWDIPGKKKLATISTRLAPAPLQPDLLLFTPDQHSLIGCGDDRICVWEMAVKQPRACFRVQGGGVTALAVSPDGRTLASGHADTTILLWDLTGQRFAEDREPDAAEVGRAWRELESADAAAAYRAMWRLALAPRQALPLLRKHVKPAAPLDADGRERVQRLLAELDSDDFGVRTRATDELVRQGEEVEPLLRQALASDPGAEVRRRLELVLRRLRTGSGQRLRLVRALEALENMRTAEARQYLEALARGLPSAWLTQQAGEALRRLDRQAGKP